MSIFKEGTFIYTKLLKSIVKTQIITTLNHKMENCYEFNKKKMLYNHIIWKVVAIDRVSEIEAYRLAYRQILAYRVIDGFYDILIHNSKKYSF